MYPHLLISFATARGPLHVADDLGRSAEAESPRRIDDAPTPAGSLVVTKKSLAIVQPARTRVPG
jgi:hypothetical protein